MVAKVIILLALAALAHTITLPLPVFSTRDIYKSFEDGIKELDMAQKRIQEMFQAKSRRKMEGSSEELEDDSDNAKDASVEKEVVEEEEGEDADNVGSVFGGMFPFLNIFRNPSKPWWTGQNVCVKHEVKEDDENKEDTKEEERKGIFTIGSAHFSTCQHTKNKYSCKTVTHSNGKTKTSSVTYKCCHGYRRNSNKPGCYKVETKPTLETGRDMGASMFISLAESYKLGDIFSKSNVTVFFPVGSGLETLQAEIAESNQLDSHNRIKETNDIEDFLSKPEIDTKLLIRNHVVPSVLETGDFHNNMILKTYGNTTLRINLFPGKEGPTLTVNCISFNETNHFTDNAIVHTINGVLKPVTKSVLETLQEERFSQFRKALEENELLSTLEGEGPVTVFALDNEAMNKFPVKSSCMKKILKHHISPYAVCTEAGNPDKISAQDLSSHWIQLQKTEDGVTTLDDSVKITKGDIVATNGIIHEVQKLLVPLSAQSISKVLQRSNHTSFLDLLQKAGLIEELENANHELVIFVPTEEAMKENEELLKKMTSEELREVAAFHIGIERIAKDTEDGLSLKTMAEGKDVHVYTYGLMLGVITRMKKVATAECVPLARTNGKACNGVLHEVEGLLIPPNGTLYELIRSIPEFKTFADVLEGTKLEEELKHGMDQVTVLIPTEQALKKMGDGNYETLLKDKSLADQILRVHVVTEPVCCAGVDVSAAWPFTTTAQTLSGATVEVDRKITHKSNTVRFAGVPVKKCDYMAKDGLAHLVDGVMLPAGQTRNTDIVFKKPNSEIILTGF